MVQRLVEGELLRLKIPAFVAPVLSAQQVVEDRLALTSFFYSIFFLLAVVVTLVSLCSVVTTVHRETAGRLHEVAVRQALGATSASVGALLLRRIVAGALVGVLGGALLATKVSGALSEALGSIGSLKDALPGLALVFAAAVAVAALSFHSFSKVELTGLLRKE
jgi:ABC-type antimicrobial peptide transport system permease subunit